MIQFYIYMTVSFFKLFFHLGYLQNIKHYSRYYTGGPCWSSNFKTQQCEHVNPKFPIYPTSLAALSPLSKCEENLPLPSFELGWVFTFLVAVVEF